MEITKISPARIYSNPLREKSKKQRGFSLIEVLLVLGILGAVMAVGIPRFRGQQTNIKSVTRQLSTLSREVRNQARVKRMTYRIVFRVGGEGSQEVDAYWVENAQANYVIPSQATREKIEAMDEREKPASPFQKVTKFFKDEKTLPTGFFIGSIETPSMDQVVTKGTANVYFTAEGLVEKAVIQITNRKDLTWSLVLNPLTGHADIVEKAIALKDLKFE